MMRLLSIALALGHARAEWDACGQPSIEWAAIDQGVGRSQANDVIFKGTDVYTGGYALGNLSITGDTPRTEISHVGSTTMDLFVYKMSSAGTPTAKFIIGSQHVGTARGYPYIYSLASMPGNDIAVAGMFMKNLSFTKTDETTITLEQNTRTGSRDYDIFVTKTDVAVGTVPWATQLAPQQDGTGRRYVRKLDVDFENNILVAGDEDSVANVAKIDGTTGAVLFDKWWAGVNDIYGMASDAAGNIYLAGEWRSEAAGMIESVAMAAAASTTNLALKLNSAGVVQWAVTLGEGSGYSLAISPDGTSIVYVGSHSSDAASILNSANPAATTVTGGSSGFIARIATADGVVTWAKDTPSLNKVSWGAGSSGAYIYAADNFEGELTIGSGAESTTITTRGGGDNSDEIAVYKFAAATGEGQWVVTAGGTGGERVYGFDVADDGSIAVAGRTDSEFIEMGTTRVDSANHVTNGGAGDRSSYVIKIGAAETTPSCLSSCTSTRTATIADGNCYIQGQCFAHNVVSPFQSCQKCEAPATGMRTWGAPDTSNHCWINQICISEGTAAPAYRNYNGPSECETCQSAVRTDGWSVVTGYMHDRDFAAVENGGHGGGTNINEYGMVFASSSNGCQLVPSIDLTGASVPVVAAAARDAAVLSVRAVSTLAAKKAAFTTGLDSMGAVRQDDCHTKAHAALDKTGSFVGKSDAFVAAAADTLTEGMLYDHIFHSLDDARRRLAGAGRKLSSTSADSWKTAFAYFETVPKATAESLCTHFGTCLAYGSAVAAVKVQQSLAAGHGAVGASNLPLAAAEAVEVKAHMLAIAYQYVLHSAYLMRTTTATTTKQQHAGHAYGGWAVIAPHLHEHQHHAHAGHEWHAGHAGHEGRISTLLLNADDYAFCAINELFSRANLTTVSAADMGTFTDGAAVVCAAPLPPSPSPPPPSPPPVRLSITSRRDELSDGAKAGIVVGATVFGLFVLLMIVLVLRSKSKGTPVFYCLDDGKPKAKP